MKEDFAFAKEELSRIGIRRIAADFYQQPKKRGNNYFVKSPATTDKTASLALYPSSNRFCDFANGNLSGDCISFVAYIKNINQWTALRILKDYYGLTDSREQNKQEIRRRILVQQEQERKKRQRQQAFKTALFACIDDMKRWASIYRTVIEKRLYEPFSDMWCYCINESQKVGHELDILCAADQGAYRWMKPGSSAGLSSDRPQWLLDTLAILAEDGAFQATESELAEIQTQKDFELLKRQPGKNRICSVTW